MTSKYKVSEIAQLLDKLLILDLRDAYVKSKVIVVAVAPLEYPPFRDEM